MSTSYGPGRYDPLYEEAGVDYPLSYVRWTLNRNMQAYLEQAANGRIDVAPFLDRVVPVVDAHAAYESLRGSGPRPLGVLIEYPNRPEEPDLEPTPAAISLRGHALARSGKVRYALVGAGAFATSMLVPRLGDDGRFFPAAVVSRDAARGGNLARSVRAEVVASELSGILDRQDIRLCVIATRHAEHAGAVSASLLAGKDVFVEKPLALYLGAARRRGQGARELPGTSSAHGRLQPAILTRASLLVGPAARAPLAVGHQLPGQRWVPEHRQLGAGPAGGGRNLGEACHMYDVFRFLAGAPAEAISASAIRPLPGVYLPTDNFTATITYGDGNLANLVYTSLGPKEGLAKERIEVFCGGEAYVLDDFRRLERCARQEELWSGPVDKGHSEEIRRLGDALVNGSPPPVPFDELVEVSTVSLAVQDLLMEGDG